MLRGLKQAIRGRAHAMRARINAQLEELMFQASIRAFRETHWMTQAVGEQSALRSIEGMRRALDAYVPPTPWADELVDEVTQVLDAVIAEQFRLQAQVEQLERLLHEALADRADGGSVAVDLSPLRG